MKFLFGGQKKGFFALSQESRYANLPNVIEIAADLNALIHRRTTVGARFHNESEVKTVFKLLKDLNHNLALIWTHARREHRLNKPSLTPCLVHFAQSLCMECALAVKGLAYLNAKDQSELADGFAKIADAVDAIDDLRKKDFDEEGKEYEFAKL